MDDQQEFNARIEFDDALVLETGIAGIATHAATLAALRQTAERALDLPWVEIEPHVTKIEVI